MAVRKLLRVKSCLFFGHGSPFSLVSFRFHQRFAHHTPICRCTQNKNLSLNTHKSKGMNFQIGKTFVLVLPACNRFFPYLHAVSSHLVKNRSIQIPCLCKFPRFHLMVHMFTFDIRTNELHHWIRRRYCIDTCRSCPYLLSVCFRPLPLNWW